MAETALSVNGRDVQRAKLYVPNQGAWFADLDLSDADPLSGAVVVRIGTVELKGTVDDEASGVFGLRRHVRVIAGAAGWRKELKPQSYLNDAGVKASSVAADAARACGESLGTFAGGAEKLGSHYLREASDAARTLEDVARGVPWWVGYDGITNVSARSVSAPAADAYEVVSFNPISRSLTLGNVDLAAVGVGATISKDLESPLVITSFELDITPTESRMTAWCGTGTTSNLLTNLQAIIERSVSERLDGVYRYRVVEMAGDRVNLQIVKRGSRAPDAISVPLWPGAASVHIQAAKGAHVLVQFVDGDRADPVVTNFAGRGSTGAIAERLVLGAASGDGADVARKGDVVDLALPPFNFAGTIGGSPASGLLTAVLPRALGVITTGSPAVGVGDSKP